MSNMAQLLPVTVENMAQYNLKKNPVPTVKKHSVLDDGIDMEDESKTLVGILADFKDQC